MFKVIVIGIVITIVGLFTLTAVSKAASNNSSGNSVNGYPTSEVLTDDNMVKVDISGEINHAGQYSISKDDTLGSLITLAGGVTSKADPKSYNEGLVIGTHTEFYIAPATELPSMCVDNDISKVNINTCVASELTEAGFNESQSENLVTYRTENGLFEAIEDIMKVKGIGQATFNKVKNKICLS